LSFAVYRRFDISNRDVMNPQLTSRDAPLASRHTAASRAIVLASIAAHAALTSWLALARYAAVHNRTFDLALYARMAWGLAHAQAWDPIVGGSFFGGHVPIVLVPLAFVGRLLGTVPVLLVSQSMAVALAAWPVSQLGARRLGAAGGMAAGLAWLLYPNLGHVATYEFHPGTLAVLPLCWALDAFDREQPRTLGLLCVAVVACRVSLTLQTFMLGLLAAAGPASMRRSGRGIALGSLAYFMLSQLWLQPSFGQASQTAAELHFGKWGGSPFGVLSVLWHAPASVLAHFVAPERLSYPLRVLAPFAFLPLLRLRWALVALPPLALNLLSAFPTASALYSHYLTPAVPALAFGAIDGLSAMLERLPQPSRLRPIGPLVLLLCSVAASALSSGLPWSHDFARVDFSYDQSTASARKVIALIGPSASVQAPDALLPHLAERALVCRVPPPERGTDFIVLDVTHRARFAHNEDLLRTIEEPLLRRWLARADYGVVFGDPRLLVLRRGVSPRSGLGRRYLAGFAPPSSGVALTDCLAVRGATLQAQRLTLELVARAACPSDLAVRLGEGEEPRRVDLLFDGLLSPAQLARGDLLRSTHVVSPAERAAIVQRGLHLGALRSSGARPRPYDPVSVEVPLRSVR
jgi:uncharacterized membrane protein